MADPDRFVLDAGVQLLRVADRPFPVGDRIANEHRPSGFCTRVCRVVFENRWQISVAWGSATYSDNYDHPFSGRELVERPARVEVMVAAPDGEWAYDGEPFGRVTAAAFLVIAEHVADLGHDAPADAFMTALAGTNRLDEPGPAM
jgi:hypothetical protein